MATSLEELRVLQAASEIADEFWRKVVQWDAFAREVVGGQLTRAADSIGANIAEAYGRFHYGEKIQFLYYSRGSLFETKYWLNRALARKLMPLSEAQGFAIRLTDLARQLNAFADSLKSQRHGGQSRPKTMRETNDDYIVDLPDYGLEALVSDEELNWLQSMLLAPELANL